MPEYASSAMTDPLRPGRDPQPDHEELYRELIEHVPAVVYLASDAVENDILYLSPQAEDLFGYPPDAWTRDRSLWPSIIHPDDHARVQRHWADRVGDGEPFAQEYRIVRRDGHHVWVRDSARLIRDDSGQPIHWQGVFQDIDERRRAEMELSESEIRYRALVEGIPAVIYEMDPDDERRTVYVSPRVVDVLGYSREEWLDQPDIWTELLHPDDRENELAAHDLHNQTGEPWNREYRLIANDGTVVWVRDQAALLPGRPDRRTWHGVMLDITAQKEAQTDLRRANDELEFRVLERTAELLEANEMMSLEIGERRRVESELRKAQERYQLLVEHLPGVVYIWQVDQATSPPPRHYISPQLESLLGFTPEEWADDRLWHERVHPHDRSWVERSADRSARTGEAFSEEFRYLAKDGRVVWVFSRASLLARDDRGRPDLFQGVMLDVTARKHAEEKAREVEARLTSLTEHGPAISYLIERRGDPPQAAATYASPQVEKVLGYARDRFIEDPHLWVKIVHPDDADWVLERSEHAWESGDPWNYDFRMIAADGRVVWVHGEGLAVEFDGTGTPRTYQGVLLDITERKLAEDRLRGSERQHRTLLEHTPGIPWMEVEGAVPGTGTLTYLGPQAESILGWTPEELLNPPGHFERMVHPEDRERVMQLSERCDVTGEPWDCEYRAVTRDGRTLWMLSRGHRVIEDGRAVWYGLLLDITARKERERVTPSA